MKAQILKVAQDLEKGTIDTDKARSLLLGLFGVSGSLQPLTISRVSKMTQDISKETWIALQGDEQGWLEWWNDRNKININSSTIDRCKCKEPDYYYGGCNKCGNVI